MNLGIFVSETWGDASGPDEIRARARSAEAFGFASGWVPYLPWAFDAVGALHVAGAATARIELGSAVIPTYLFHPLALARQASSLEAALGRGVALGIGCSNEAVIAMHGLAYERPARHVREYAELMARAFESAGQVSYEGELFNAAALYGVPGDAPRGRLLIGGLGPRMLAAAGSVSDGTIATWCDPRAIDAVIAPGVRAAAAEVGRPTPTVGAVVPVLVCDDVAAGRAAAREAFAIYDSLPRYRRVVELGEGEHPGDVCVVGGVGELRDALHRFEDAGLTDFLAAPLARLGSDWQRSADALAEAASLA